MKLICPNCGAGFEVRAEALGPAGRTVRCSACRHQWLARAAVGPPPAATSPAGPAADAAPAPPPAPLEPEPIRAPAEAEILPPRPAPEPPEVVAPREAAILRAAEPPAAPAAAPTRAQPDEAPLAGAPPTRTEVLPPRRRAALVGWILLAAVLMALGAAVMMREQVMASFPETRPVFRTFGFRVPSHADGLDIIGTQPTWVRNAADGQALLVIEGRVKNHSGGAREIPPLRAVLRNGTVEVQSWIFAAAAPRIAAGAEVTYRTEIRSPPQATTVAVVFSTAE